MINQVCKLNINKQNNITIKTKDLPIMTNW